MGPLRLVWSKDEGERAASPSPQSARALRLVWNEGPVGVAFRPSATRAASPLRMDLALAIERHLKGADGLTDEQFLRLFAHGLQDRTRHSAPIAD